MEYAVPSSKLPDVKSSCNVLTNSSMSTFKQCRRKYFYSYEILWRPIKRATALRFGDAVHQGLDGIAMEWTIQQIIDHIDNIYAEETERLKKLAYTIEGLDITDRLDYECETIKALVLNYQIAWRNSDVKIVESEKSFELPIVNGKTGRTSRTFRQAGKRDRICTLPDGRLALMETKTSSEDITPGSEYRDVITIDQQVSMYIAAAQADGYVIETTVYDVIRKPSIRPSSIPLLADDGFKIVLDAEGERAFKSDGKPRQSGDSAKGYKLQSRIQTPQEWSRKLTLDIASRPEYYFQRWEVSRLQDEIVEFQLEMWDIAKDINECRHEHRWYRNTTSCRKWNRLCEYYPLCAGQCDMSGDVPTGFRLAEVPHEELEQECKK